MGDYKVNGTTYRFPDSYDDEKVKGILAAQGVISTAPAGPKVPALPRGLQADAPPPYSQGATAEKHGFKWQPEQEMSPEKFGEQLPGAAVTLASALMGPEVGILGRMAGVGGTGAASTMLGNLLQGKPQDMTESAINGGLAAGTEGIGSVLGKVMQGQAAKSAAAKQVQELLLGHQATQLEHRAALNELTPKLAEAQAKLKAAPEDEPWKVRKAAKAVADLQTEQTRLKTAHEAAGIQHDKVKLLQGAEGKDGGLLSAVGKTVGGPVGKAASIYALYRLLSGQGQ